MSEFKLTVLYNGETKTVPIQEGESLLNGLRNAGYREVNAPCGGNGTCGQCKIKVTGKLKKLSDVENVVLVQDEELLACRYSAASDCHVFIPEASAMEVMVGGACDITPEGKGLGIAVDIGTTTVAVFLYELETGKLLDVESGRNAQRSFGADVISRIQFCNKDEGLSQLRSAINKQIDEAIDILCKKTGKSREQICLISIAGNTVMEHIFAGLSPVSIGVAPFKTLSLFGNTDMASNYFDGVSKDAKIYMCPALAGYVGGDITAGLLKSGAWQTDKTCLFIDIGTNGEMGIGDKDGYTCCATAAGPAFEGAEISCGMDASAGAVNRVCYVNGEIKFETIGNAKASGMCGSGLIDALDVMLQCGAVEESGRMISPDEAPPNIAERLKRDGEGKMRFHLTEAVYISAEDVRQLQLAKAAIRSGIETLLELRSKNYEDIASVIIAGGFGAFMSVESACAIGLLPPAVRYKTVHVGNAAGGGAAMALNLENRILLTEFTSKCDYHELSSSTVFMEKYIESMVFDEVFEIHTKL